MQHVCAWMKEMRVNRLCESMSLFRDEPATRIGAALLVLNYALLAINIVAPAPYSRDPHTGLPVLNGGMALLQQPFDTTAFLVILVVCGCWLQIRLGATVLQCGWAAAKITLLAGAPAVLAGLLVLSGLLRVIVLGPGETPTTFREHGFAMTYYSAQAGAPAPWLQLVSVVFRVWQSFFWGVLGALLGRGITAPGRRSSPQPA